MILRDLGGVSSPRPSGSWTQTQPLNSSDLLQITNHTLIILYLILSVSLAHLHICTQHFLCLDIISYLIFYIYFIFLWLAASCQPCSTCLHIPLCTVMLILIFNSTAYCHAHSLDFIFYILFFISYFLFILFYVYFPCVVFFNICTVHGADPTLISLLVIQSLYSRVCEK